MPQLSYITLPLITNGTQNGTLSVPSTLSLAKGATIFLVAKGRENKQLVVDEVLSETSLVVRDPNSGGYTAYDCSGYSMQNGAQITQPEQYCPNSPLTFEAPVVGVGAREQAVFNLVSFLRSKIDILEEADLGFNALLSKQGKELRLEDLALDSAIKKVHSELSSGVDDLDHKLLNLKIEISRATSELVFVAAALDERISKLFESLNEKDLSIKALESKLALLEEELHRPNFLVRWFRAFKVWIRD